MLQIVPQWLRLLAWPAHLRAEYSPGEFVASKSFGAPEALGLVLVLGAITAIWYARRRAPGVAFGVAWTAVALIPVSNVLLPTGILIAERTLFLPSVGFVLAVGGLVTWLLERPRFAGLAWRRGLAIATGILVIAGVARSASRERVWRDPQSLTFARLVDAPQSWRVEQAHGEMLFDSGDPGDAVLAFRDAIANAPETWRPRNRLAQRLRMIGDDENALLELRLSLKENPGRIETIMQIPPVLLALGKYDEAKQLADSIVAAEDAPPVMVLFSHIADSARTAKAPPGSIRIGVPPR
jgi:tetratricopeptide (TPR) repeat protein